jgi:RHS repeat-associated protein
LHGRRDPHSSDSQGNIIQRGSQAYVFDQGNRMSSATGKATYGYDGLGHRVSVVGSDIVNRVQIYSQGGQMLYAGPTGTTGTKYIYLRSHVIAEVGAAGTQFDHTDGLGSPVAIRNASAAVFSRTRYEPYGLTASGDVPKIGFTGHVNDSDTGLVYMQQRYYDPVAGRFLSIDPVTTDARTGNSFNRYVYAENNPYTYVDPDGRQAVVIIRRPRTDDPFYSPVQSSRGGDPIARKIVQIFNNVTSPSPAPIPPDDDKEKSEYKRPNDQLEKGDKLDMARFDRRVKVEGETRFQDQKSGYQVSPDRGGDKSHGGSAFKLINSSGKRIATLNSDGLVLRKP